MSNTNPLYELTESRTAWTRGVFSQAGSTLFAQVAKPEVTDLRTLAVGTLDKFANNPAFSSRGPALLVDRGLQRASIEKLLDATHTANYERGWLTFDEAPALSNQRTRIHDLATSDATAFSNLELIRSTWAPNLAHYLGYLRRFFRRDYGAALAARLDALASLAHEDEDQAPLSAVSVAHLIGFLEKHKVARPKLALGPSGEILAIWRQEGEGEFSARFLTTGAVRFLLNKRSPAHPDGISRTSGDTTADELFARAGLADTPWVLQP